MRATSLVHKARSIGAGVLCGIVLGASSIASDAAPLLGVHRWNPPTGPSNVDAYNQWLGKPVDLATGFVGRNSWDAIAGEWWSVTAWGDWVKAQPGRNVALAIPMLPDTGGSLANCAAGQYDTYWARLANNLAYAGLHWAYLRLGWEMDGNWYMWSAAPGSGNEANFAGCFRRIVQVMRQAEPANQWKFVLNSAGVWQISQAYLDAVWPGDAYVDVVAIDLYDQSWAPNTYPYPSPCDDACRAWRQQNAWNDYGWRLYLVRDYAVAHGKTVGLPEWGTGNKPDGHGGGDNTFFIRKMYDFMQDPANRVEFHGYWDVQASDFDSQLSGATNFPQAAALYKQLFSANAAPTVSITAPASGATVSGTALAYAANASDDAGVSRVDFFVDSTALVSDSSAPYGGTLDTTKLANGTHTLRAVAYDAAGLSASSQVSINVQNTTTSTGGTTGTTATQAPGSGALDIWFKSPLAGSTVKGVLNAGTSCYAYGTGVSRVAFFVDGTALNTDTSMSDGLQCVFDTTKIPNGSHQLKAQAFDASGNSRWDVISINVQNPVNAAPTVSLTAPASGATVSGAALAYAANASDDAGVSRVDFFIDSTALVSDASAPYGGTLDTTQLANGTHVLKAVAYDAAGLSATSQVSISVQNTTTTTGGTTGTTATQAPGSGALDIWFKSPLAGSTVKGVLNGGTGCYAYGTGVSRVAFFVDDTALNTDTSMSDGLQCVLDTTKLANGTHQLKAQAFDASGNSRWDVISINVENTATVALPVPTSGSLDLWFKAPLDGQTVSGVLSMGSCYMNGVGLTRVAFSLDGAALNTDGVMSDGVSCVLDTSKFAKGAHQLKAVGYDASGNARGDVININIQ